MFLSNTSYKMGVTSSMEWSEFYKFIEDGDSTDEYEYDIDDFEDIKKSSLQIIATRPTILPYYDMVSWFISHTDISTCTIVKYARKVIGSFILDDISYMYKLGSAKVCLDDKFIEGFIEKEVKKEEIKMGDLIMEWWHDPSTFTIISDKMYPIRILEKSSILVAIIICLLYGENDYLNFKLGWVPLIHHVLKG